MSATRRERKLYSQAEIARRVKAAARDIAHAARQPEIAVPILAGAFVFAADLLRALAREGIDLETEFIWLRSYGRFERPGDITVLKGPAEAVRGKTVLLIDGVLESGGTLARAKQLLADAGAGTVISIVAVKKPYAESAVGCRSCAVHGGQRLHLRLRHGSRRVEPRSAGHPRETRIAEKKKPPCSA